MTPRFPDRTRGVLALLALWVAACSDDSPTLTEADPLAELTIRTENVSLEVFGTDTLVAEARRESGRLFDDPDVEWRSFRDQVATIDASGVVTGHSIGEALFTASFGRLTARVSIEVRAPAEARLTLSPDSVLLGEGGRLQLSGTLAMPDGREVPGAVFQWSTSDGAVAEVSAQGVVTGGRIGSARVSAKAYGRTAEAEVDVTYGWQEVSPSASHTCAVRADGRAYCWGSNRTGALGIGESDPFVERAATRPFPVVGDRRFTTLTLGDHHTCGLDEDGVAWCWGWNDRGALGTEAVDPNCTEGSCWTEPVRVDTEVRFTALSAGEDHSCGIAEDGFGLCWGRNTHGQVGVESPFGEGDSFVRVPARISLDRTLRQLSLGSWSRSHALTLDGQPFVLGQHYWEVPAGEVEDERCDQHHCFLPRPVPGGLTFEDLVGGLFWTCGLTSVGDVYCWGLDRPDPAPVDLGQPAVELGRSHMSFLVCAITADRAGHCWESPSAGGGRPFALRGDLRLKTIAAAQFGNAGVCGVTISNLGYCWTWGSDGDPRDAQPELLPEPVELP